MINGISKLDLKRQNRKQLLKVLQTEGPTSRVDLAQKIGITKAAVTIIANEMIEQGIVFEKGEQITNSNKNPRGRRKILLDINPTYKTSMGLVIDAGFIYIGLSTLKCDIIERRVNAISLEDTSEDILTLIEKIYKDISEENFLNSESVVGIGIAVSEEYYGMFNILKGTDGTLDYSKFAERLAEFIGVPMTFGSIMEGIVTAQLDSYNLKRSENVISFRYTKNFDCAVSIGEQIYNGAHGRKLDLSKYKVTLRDKKDCIKNLFSPANIGACLKEIYSPEKTPILWKESGGNFQNATELLEGSKISLQDEALIKLVDDIAKGYLKLFEDMIAFFDPDRIILFADREVDSCLAEYVLDKTRKAFNAEEEIVVKSRFNHSNVFLVASSLAIHEFFINKGGF